MLLLLVACADEGGDELQGNRLQLSSVTRADDGTIERLTNGHIKLFVTTKTGAVIEGIYNNIDGSGWGESAPITENTQYYIYGYMPNDGTVVTGGSSLTDQDSEEPDLDYSKGANLTLGGLPVFTQEDICVVVGVQRITERTETPATAGIFDYPAGLSDQNYVNLLMAHLYVKLQLQFNVESEYYALRRIHLKSVKLKSKYGEAVNATLKLRKGVEDLTEQNVGYVSAGAGDKEVSLLTYDGDNPDPELELVEAKDGVEPTMLTKTVNCPHCLFEIIERADGTKDTYLTIESTYDVYDINGNLIRENCTATNKVWAQDRIPGTHKKLTLTVAPTYLYMLSEPDLDNPTIEVKSE